jgi:hypothetical protein
MWSRKPWMRKKRTTSLAAFVPMLGLMGLAASSISTAGQSTGSNREAVNHSGVGQGSTGFATQDDAQVLSDAERPCEPYCLNPEGDRSC